MSTETADVCEAWLRTGTLTRAELVRENASLRARLDAMRGERDAAQRAHRRRSYWGAMCALCDRLTGRDTR